MYSFRQLRVLCLALLPAMLAARACADDFSWVDRLPRADAATKQRLKICATSATANYALLRRLSFDFELRHEGFLRDPAGKFSFFPRSNHGTVRWRDGAVRYDIEGDNPYAPVGPVPKGAATPTAEQLKLLSKFGVIRTKEMLAHTEIHVYFGAFLVVDFPPTTIGDWKYHHTFQIPILDPWVHYASNFRIDSPSLREFWQTCRIESEESKGVIQLRVFRTDSPGRGDIYCDRASDYLPVRARSGEMRGKEFNVIVETATEWLRTDGVWYPSHFVQTAYMGADRRSRKEWDLTVRNLRVGAAADVPNSAFSLDTLEIPERYGGVDRRVRPPKQLIKIGSVVRERRMGDPKSPSKGYEKRLAAELAQANKEAEAILRQRGYRRAATWGLSLLAAAGFAALAWRIHRRRRSEHA
ncbi:MAG: hypothetical protein ACP5XB_22940, partial [Isosphaeraceae bacterium]